MGLLVASVGKVLWQFFESGEDGQSVGETTPAPGRG